MHYTMTGIDPATYQVYFDMEAEALAAAKAIIMTSDAAVGFPCRATLDDAPPGTRLLLINHVSQTDGPYAARHAIFISEHAEVGSFHDEIAPALNRRLLSLRAFSKDGLMADAVLAEPGEADQAIRRLLANPSIDHIDAHYALRGCFAARVERA